MIILGIDPGLVNTGWGIIKVEGNKNTYIADGTIKTKSTTEMSIRLMHLYTELKKVIDEYKPSICGIETAFVGKFAKSALALGQARGIALLTPAIFNVSVMEFTPNQIKKSIVGGGHAQKGQIDMMVKTLLRIQKCDSEHSADALAIALTSAFNNHLTNI